MISRILTQETLKKLLHYDPDTGLFIWRARDRCWFPTDGSFKTWNTKFAGKSTGCVRTHHSGKSYVVIGIFNKLRQAHRLAWLYVYGKFPENEIDHQDGDGCNNKIKNLRDATRIENGRNIRLPADNTSGFLGVCWDNSREKWMARIKANNRDVYLGRFDLLEDAIKARKAANIKYSYHPNHGSKRPL